CSVLLTHTHTLSVTDGSVRRRHCVCRTAPFYYILTHYHLDHGHTMPPYTQRVSTPLHTHTHTHTHTQHCEHNCLRVFVCVCVCVCVRVFLSSNDTSATLNRESMSTPT